ncbi:MAG: rhomboid family intramembrane serine protease [Chloroflexi bacterium]|nr:rhomboid family intramembrane serine protease [Chloroflexota bacterium]
MSPATATGNTVTPQAAVLVERFTISTLIPLGDSLSSRKQPIVTLGLIVACGLVFLYELTLRGAALDLFVQRWGAVPQVVLAALVGDPRAPRWDLLTLFSSQFIHAGFLHLAGNMLFLWVFGRSVEDRVGSVLYLVLYLLLGALAGVVQCVISATETVPLIGASGAIAGVLGIYFISYPTAWVRVLVPVLFFFWTFDLPALLVLAFWFVSQFFSGIAAITHASRATGQVAVWAHVAGFALGAASAPFLPRSSRVGMGAAAPAIRRANAPGPARLVSSIADLAALLLAARLALHFFGLVAPRSPLALVAGPVFGVTDPVVAPFHEFLPDLRLLGGVLETAALAAIAVVYLVAGLLGQLFLKR